MRLSPDHIHRIQQCVHQHLGAAVRIWLFGSRVNPQRRGGDVDLYVETPLVPDLRTELRCKLQLKEALDLGVDLVLALPGASTPIAQLAKTRGVEL